jgi:hypothetical protein
MHRDNGRARPEAANSNMENRDMVSNPHTPTYSVLLAWGSRGPGSGDAREPFRLPSSHSQHHNRANVKKQDQPICRV